jgi:hypothetical protein
MSWSVAAIASAMSAIRSTRSLAMNLSPLSCNEQRKRDSTTNNVPAVEREHAELVVHDVVRAKSTAEVCQLRVPLKMPRAIISPSVLASDFGQLTAECQRMIKNGAEWLHMGLLPPPAPTSCSMSCWHRRDGRVRTSHTCTRSCD